MIGGTDSDDAGSDSYVLIELVAVAHRVEERRIVVEIQNIEVDGDGGRKARTSRVLGLHHENVMLDLDHQSNEK